MYEKLKNDIIESNTIDKQEITLLNKAKIGIEALLLGHYMIRLKNFYDKTNQFSSNEIFKNVGIFNNTSIS